jgi:enamine deaminase RidA (YjgF/YER057c/UK114 family)
LPWIGVPRILSGKRFGYGRIEMERITVTPAGMAPLISPISYAVVDEGRLYISGMLPVDDKWNVVGKGDITTQAERTFELCGKVLEAAGCSFEHVLKTTTYLVNATDYKPFNEVRKRAFRAPYPASTAVVVKALVLPDALIEIELIARMAR